MQDKEVYYYKYGEVDDGKIKVISFVIQLVNRLRLESHSRRVSRYEAEELYINFTSLIYLKVKIG